IGADKSRYRNRRGAIGSRVVSEAAVGIVCPAADSPIRRHCAGMLFSSSDGDRIRQVRYLNGTKAVGVKAVTDLRVRPLAPAVNGATGDGRARVVIAGRNCGDV